MRPLLLIKNSAFMFSGHRLAGNECLARVDCAGTAKRGQHAMGADTDRSGNVAFSAFG